MTVYVYKVIPAPTQGLKGKGVKGVSARFANSLETSINDLAVDGWEYVRSESLPSVDRVGMTRKRVESFQNVMVFRKPADQGDLADALVAHSGFAEEKDEPEVVETPEPQAEQMPEPAVKEVADAKVEEAMDVTETKAD